MAILAGIAPHSGGNVVPSLPKVHDKSGLIAFPCLAKHPACCLLEEVVHPTLPCQQYVRNPITLLKLPSTNESKGAYNADALFPDSFPVSCQVIKQSSVLVHKPGAQKLIAAQIHKIPVVDVLSVREIEFDAFLLAGGIPF